MVPRLADGDRRRCAAGRRPHERAVRGAHRRGDPAEYIAQAGSHATAAAPRRPSTSRRSRRTPVGSGPPSARPGADPPGPRRPVVPVRAVRAVRTDVVRPSPVRGHRRCSRGRSIASCSASPADHRGQHLQQRGRDPVGARAADREHRAVVARPTVGAMLDASRSPGGSACSPARFSSCSPRQLFNQTPVPGAVTPEP